MERQDGTDKDFEGLKQNLIRAALKRQEAELTQKLLKRLKNEYEVSVDQAMIDRISPQGPAAGDADKVAITIGELKIQTNFVFASIEKTQKTRGHAKRQAEAFENSKGRVVNDILVQVLTERAALDRHYEEVPPLKHVYDFYRKYRLVKEFEATVVKPQVKVTEEAIKAYYRDNQEQFSRKGMIEYALVTTNESKLAEKIALQLKNGADFFTIMEPISPTGVQIRKEPLVHLRPSIQEAVKSLASGQVVTIADAENTHFVKVVRAVETELLPLEKVREMIVKSLEKQLFNEIRDGYIAQLRERSTIKVDKGTWKSLREQLLEEGAS